MRKYLFRLSIAAAIVFVAVMGLTFFSPVKAHGGESSECSEENLYCLVDKLAVGEETLRTLPSIKVTAPVVAPAASRTVTYSVQTRGNITASVAEFKALANETLNSAKGWARMGVSFQQAESGGSFTLVLTEASQVPTFSNGCDSTYSCNVGNFVIINQDRWLGATPSWNAAGGSLRDYRHMVVNHETGHWLGHGHAFCGGAGQKAPVMQQQSINLQGCSFNPWPLTSELHSTRLGL